MKFKPFEPKPKDAELDAFDILLHHVHMLDVIFDSATQTNDKEFQIAIADRMQDANDRYLTVILGLEGEEPRNDTEQPKQQIGFRIDPPSPPLEGVDAPDGEPGGL